MNAEIWPLFLDEATLGLETLEVDVERMCGPDPVDGIRSAFRVMHNLKGAARMAGCIPIELVAHRLEDLLADGRRSGRLPLSAIERVREGMGLIAALLASPGSDPGVGPFLDAMDVTRGPAVPAPPVPPSLPPSAAPAAAPAPRTAPPNATPRPASAVPPAGEAGRAMIRVEATRVDQLMDFAGEFMVTSTRLGAHQTALEDVLADLERVRREVPEAARAELAKAMRALGDVVQAHRGEVARLGHAISGWTASLHRVRMLPLEGAVARWRLVVAEAAHAVGREARLVADVGELEIDRQILDALQDPIMHLLRNAVAHGVEPAAERVAAGKPRQGTVTLRARPVGAMVSIEVTDDGRGLDPARIGARALELGLVDSLDRLGPAEISDLVFSPGFSTTREVDPISGRGVGLDVVRRRLSELGGLARIVPSAHAGTTFRLEAPASMVSTRGLLVRVEDASCVLPASYVVRTLRVPASAVGAVDGRATAPLPDGVPIRLRWLASVLGRPRSTDPERLLVVVLTDGASAPIGLVVQELVGEVEFVTRRLPWNVPDVPGVAGATIAADGSVALVLDAPQLVAESRLGDGPRAERVVAAEPLRRRRVLVVDDSLTSRTLERNILTAAGYDVTTEVDGEAAWALLEADASFDLVVTDVQMPRLDGLALTRRIRAHPRTQQLPVVLVTSLGSGDDLDAGAAAGADEYIVKGRFDQHTLLETVARLV